ncbi:Transmembrane protein 18 [Irineochytrium annulatum]|nr:Transmembrane protein 18 [Irineochytrium annulatum]
MASFLNEFLLPFNDVLSSFFRGDIVGAFFPRPIRDAVLGIWDLYQGYQSRSHSDSDDGDAGPSSRGRDGADRHRFNFGDLLSMRRAVDEFMTDSSQFYNAVEWDDPFIILLITFHVCSLGLVMAFRKSPTGLFGLMSALGFLVLASESINTWANENFNRFTNTNYFDQHGVFMATMLAGPICLNLVLVMFFILRRVVSLLVEAKSKQIKQEMGAKKRAAGKKTK